MALHGVRVMESVKPLLDSETQAVDVKEQVCACVCVWVYVCMCVYMYVCMYACMHACMCVCMYVYKIR